jgi:hypothetical protein
LSEGVKLKFQNSSFSGLTWIKILGLTVLLFALMSLNYVGLGLSASLSTPIALIAAAFLDTLVLSYFAISSRIEGAKQWLAVFLVLYVGNYVLTAMESLYLTSLLTEGIVVSILVNGAIISGVFAFAVTELLRRKSTQTRDHGKRLVMPMKEWIWKIGASGALYLFLFVLVGFLVYTPFASLTDPAALAKEQAALPASAAGLVFPLEFLRGIIWTLLAVVATLSLPFNWKKTALVAGLMLAAPVSTSIFLSNSIAPGLQIAHFAELFIENFLFGFAAVWILHLRSRLSSQTVAASTTSSSVTVSPA